MPIKALLPGSYEVHEHGPGSVIVIPSPISSPKTRPSPPAYGSALQQPRRAPIGVATNEIIHSTGRKYNGQAFAFLTTRYSEVKGGLTPHNLDFRMCLDSGATASVVDRQWLLAQLPDARIEDKGTGVNFQGVHSVSKEHRELAYFQIYIAGTLPTGERKITCLQRGAWVVDELLTGILIGMDIIVPDEISSYSRTKGVNRRMC